MKLSKNFVVIGCLLSLFSLNIQAQPLSFNVSADPGNDTGVFSGFDPATFWTSGDIALPNGPGTSDSGIAIGSTPLEIDLTLSHNLTLDGSGHYAWFLNYADPIPENSDLGTLTFELLENGTAITPQVGFDAGPNGFGGPVTQFATGNSDLTPNLTFNGVDIFVSNANPETLTDLQIELDVPEASTLSLLSLGFAIMLAFGYRKMNTRHSQL